MTQFKMSFGGQIFKEHNYFAAVQPASAWLLTMREQVAVTLVRFASY